MSLRSSEAKYVMMPESKVEPEVKPLENS
jgi:hypothetical protein